MAGPKVSIVRRFHCATNKWQFTSGLDCGLVFAWTVAQYTIYTCCNPFFLPSFRTTVLPTRSLLVRLRVRFALGGRQWICLHSLLLHCKSQWWPAALGRMVGCANWMLTKMPHHMTQVCGYTMSSSCHMTHICDYTIINVIVPSHDKVCSCTMSLSRHMAWVYCQNHVIVPSHDMGPYFKYKLGSG